MAVQITVPVFRQKRGGDVVWTTVGLGPYNCSQRSGSAVKVQRKLAATLRKAIADLDPADLDLFQLPRGIELTFTRIDLALRAERGGGRVSGVFPVVVEPRWTGAESRVHVVYHPLRPDDWFAGRDRADALDRVPAFFRAVWADLDRAEIEALIAHRKDSLGSLSLSATPRSLLDKLPRQREAASRAGVGEPGDPDVLAKVGVDQTLRALEGTLPLGMPREPHRQTMQLLVGGQRRRPTLVVGPPGSGKTTIINRWIADLLVEDEFEIHRDLDRIHRVWAVSGKRVIAGMSMLGDWERRCIDLLVAVKRQRAILVVEDLHLFGRLGQTRDSDRNLAEFFRGPIARGELLVVAELTAEKLARLEEDAPALAGLFARVHVQPASRAETMQMMLSAARDLEQRCGAWFHPFSYRAVIELGGALLPWRAFPGVALDLLARLAELTPTRPGAAGPGDGASDLAGAAGDDGDGGAITPAAVVALLSEHTGLPANLLTLDAPLDAGEVHEAFASRVMGQPAALAAATDLVLRVRAGLTDAARPLAVMLFTGPTGTGKTEMARCIAEYLFGDAGRLARFDMSEYAGPDAVARLIGDRYQPEGLLTQRIREQPFQVVLFDEIEKAHPLVLGLLLQLFDEARLTDASGEAASFQQAVVLMTSNLGARPHRPIGFGDSADRVMGEIDRAVREFFSPELFNRIDRVVPFAPLSAPVAEAIATKELARLLARRGLEERNIFVYANRAVKERIVREAFDPAFGARTVKRYLEDRIGSLLAAEITGGRRAAMRVMRLYEAAGAGPGDPGATGGAEFRLHVEELTEMAPEPAHHVLAPLLEQTALRVAAGLGDAARALAAVADSPAYATLDERVRESEHAAELYYFADAYKQRVESLRDWLAARAGHDAHDAHDAHDGADAALVEPRHPAAVPRAEKASKDTLLDRIAEAYFLAGRLDQVTDPAAHVAWVELLRVGHGDPGGRVRAADRGLLHWMLGWTLDTARASGDDWVEAVSLRYAGGGADHFTGEGALAAARAAVDGSRSRRRTPVHAVIKLSGLFALDAFRGEDGCHIWRPATAEPQIVRVRVWGGDPDGQPSAVMREHARARAAFEAALEASAAELPANPEALAPAVRTLNFRAPLRGGEVFPVEVVDYRMGYRAALHVRAPGDALRLLWLLRKSRAPHRAAAADPGPDDRREGPP